MNPALRQRCVSHLASKGIALQGARIILLLFDSSGFVRVIAHFGSCNWDFLLGLFQEIPDHRDHSLLFRKQGEVAGIRDHGELGVGDELQGLNGVFNADKIVISQSDEKRRIDGCQFFVRKSQPLNAAHLAPKLGPESGSGATFL